MAAEDLTHGRAALPFSETEKLMRSDPYTTVQTTVTTQTHTVYCQTWSRSGTQPVADILFLHGLGDYGGRTTPQWARALCDAGFRITAMDFPGHGRTSGLHGHLTSVDHCIEAARVVRTTHMPTLPPSKSSKTFLMCGSFGGLVGITFAAKYGSELLDGMVVYCPLIIPQGESRPSIFVEVVAKILNWIPYGGTLPIAEANRGKNSSDPNNEIEFQKDPMGYTGNMRIGTGLAILDGLEALQGKLQDVTIPFLVMHGDKDRVCSLEGARLLKDRATSQDKTLIVWDGQEHDLSREPKSAEVIDAAIKWMTERC
ncbi:hypothetical protein HK104_008528 [Borealophlyctis nickersoniae]|nr:hypothetical protein HK104_008528 [Borealophlyctis nickersoniae]